MKFKVIEPYTPSEKINYVLSDGTWLYKKDWKGNCYEIEEYGKTLRYYPNFRVEEWDDNGVPTLSPVVYFKVREVKEIDFDASLD